MNLGWVPARTHALIIGVLEWRDPTFSSFPKPGRKDREYGDALMLLGVPASKITYLEDKEATLSNIRKYLDWHLLQMESDESFIFYFAGHGSRRERKNLLVNYDANRTDMLKTCFDLQELRETLHRQFRGRRVMLFADCCFSGALTKLAHELQRQANYDILVLASADRHATSTGKWTFTECLIEIFTGSRGVDSDGDGYVSFAEAADYIEQAMRYEGIQTSESGVSRNVGAHLFFFSRASLEVNRARRRVGAYYANIPMEAHFAGVWWPVVLVIYERGWYWVQGTAFGLAIPLPANQIRPIAHSAFYPVGSLVRAWIWSSTYHVWFGYRAQVIEARHRFRLVRYFGRWKDSPPDWYTVAALTE